MALKFDRRASIQRHARNTHLRNHRMTKVKTNTLQTQFASLFGRINYEGPNRPRPGDFKLANMYRLLERLGNPHLHRPVIHVAGTKGKGSVSSMLGQILTACDKRIGVYTSPHLEQINQRIAINGQTISDQHLAQTLAELQPHIDYFDAEADRLMQRQLTFFEVVTAAAFLHFSKQNVDAIVLEVGMGGRLDSTNVCQPVLAIITSISHDHTRQLGNTLTKIAGEKAGIIKPGTPVVSGVTDPEAAAKIADVAGKNHCRIYRLDREFNVRTDDQQTFEVSFTVGAHHQILSNLNLPLLGAHQVTNASIAVAACHVLNSIHTDQHTTRSLGWEVNEPAIRQGLASTILPGRAELLSDVPAIMVDMAHNVASINALAETLLHHVPAFNKAGRRRLIFSVSSEKDVKRMLDPLMELFDEIILTQYTSNPRAKSIADLTAMARKLLSQKTGPTCKVDSVNRPELAWQQVYQSHRLDDFICVTGSAFLIAELRPAIVGWLNNR